MRAAHLSLLFACSMALSSLQAQAGCAERAIAGAPKMPDLVETNLEAVIELQGKMRDYMTKAESRLEKCGAETIPANYNLAVAQLEYRANTFNRLANFYIRNSGAIASNP